MALSVPKLIGVVVLVIVGLLMLPIVQVQVSSAQNTSDSTTVDTLLGMVTIFYALGVVLAAVMWTVHETGGFGKK